MASIEGLHTDILFCHVFNHLDTSDIWKLRLTCRKMRDITLDYFANACISLSLCSAEKIEKHNVCVAFGAGVNILKICNCKHFRRLKIIGGCNQTDKISFIKIISLLIEKDKLSLKALSLSDLDLASISFCLNSFSCKCKKLVELELCRVSVPNMTVQYFLQKFLQYNTNCLKKLKLESLTFASNTPLPTESLTLLQYISVNKCSNLSSECSLEEVFRKCPHLEVVDMREVTSVSNRTLLVLMEYCTKISHVYVRGCPCVALQSLCHPKISKVVFDVLDQQETAIIVPSRDFNILGQI